MIEVSIHNVSFVNACRAIGSNLSLYDNSLYHFSSNGYAIGFKEKRAYTTLTDMGYWRPSGTRARLAQEELDDVNRAAALLNFVRQNFDQYVESMHLSTLTTDIWKNARVLLTVDRVFVQFPDVRGRVTMRQLSVKKEKRCLPITVMPSLAEKLLGICEAAELPTDFDPFAVISDAYNGICETQDRKMVAIHGYAVVLLLQNKIEGLPN